MRPFRIAFHAEDLRENPVFTSTGEFMETMEAQE
jgi:hypothetical protein